MQLSEVIFIRCSPELKEWAEDQAKKEYRSGAASFVRSVLEKERSKSEKSEKEAKR